MSPDVPRAVEVHDEQAALFEARYEQYERDPFYDSFSYSRRKLEQVLARYLAELPDGARLLDVGCGTGQLLGRLGPRFRCAGCDPAEQMIRRARTAHPEIPFEIATAESLPYGDASFDVVMCVEVMRYLDAPERALRELARVLRPGGLALVTFAPLFSTTLYPLVNAVSGRIGVPGLTRVRQHFHTVRETKRLVRAAGFERSDVNAVYFGPFIYVNRISRRATSALLRRWERIDDRVARIRPLANVANMFVVAAWTPVTSSTFRAPRSGAAARASR